MRLALPNGEIERRLPIQLPRIQIHATSHQFFQTFIRCQVLTCQAFEQEIVDIISTSRLSNLKCNHNLQQFPAVYALWRGRVACV